MKRLTIFVAFLCPFCSSIFLFAQTQCSGGYGDPIFTETFGTSPDGDRNPIGGFGSTTYTFDPGDGTSPITAQAQIDDDEYTLYSGDPWDLNNGWHFGTDHTGNTNGNMAVFNASFTPGVFYERDVSDLCPGTRMLFSAWIANILDTDNQTNAPFGNNCVESGSTEQFPNVRFEIFEQGTSNSLGFVETGILPSFPAELVWIEYTFELNLPQGVSNVTVQLSNSNPGGCGNDLAIDDISFRACGPLANVVSGQAVICEDQEATLLVDIDEGYVRPYFQWQKYNDVTMMWEDVGPAGPTVLSYVVTSPENGDIYRYLAAGALSSLSDPDCRINSNPFTISTVDLVSGVQVIGGGGTICRGEPVTLIATIPPAADPADPDGVAGTAPYTFQWFDPNLNALGSGTNIGNDMNEITVSTWGFDPPNNVWTVDVIDAAGCTASDLIPIDYDCFLPVDLLYFKAEWLEDKKALISWGTSSEQNNDRFILQRSTDNYNDFENIAEIQGSGTIENAISEYAFTDKMPGGSSMYYYRLIQVDTDGTKNYSNIISLKSQGQTKLYFVNDDRNHAFQFNMELSQARFLKKIQIFNSLGEQVHTHKVETLLNPGRHQMDVDVAGFMSGIYLISFEFEHEHQVIKGLKW